LALFDKERSCIYRTPLALRWQGLWGDIYHPGDKNGLDIRAGL
jgi:hypothetical protein